MNGKIRKLTVLMLVVMLMVVTACTSNNEGGNTEGQEGNDPKSTEASAEGQTTENGQPAEPADPLGKFEQTVTLTASKILEGDVKFRDGESIDNNVLDRTILEELNIDMEYLFTAKDSADLSEKIRLALSANQELPDMLMIDDLILFQQLVESGRYQPVSEVFDKYAVDNWKQAYENYPDLWKGVTVDGKRYGLPMFSMAGRGNVMWIREDWLKKLDLKAPTTMEEFEQVMDAFTNQDPDGNQEDDTFGLALSLKNGGINNKWLGSPDVAFAADGILSSDYLWLENEDGQLYQPYFSPETKQGLTRLQDWMNKGYFPKDSGLYDEMKAAELFNSGKAGIVFGAYWLSIWPFPDLIKNVPGADFKAYPYPAGPDGTLKVESSGPGNGRIIMIKKDMEHPEAVIKYLNFFFKHYLNPDKGSKYEYGLAEGYDWAMVDGKPTSDKSKVPNYLDVVRYSVPKDITLPGAWIDMLTKFTNGGKPETPLEIKQYGGEDERSLEAAEIVLNGLENGQYQSGVVGVPSTPTQQAKGAMLTKMKNEALFSIIYGDSSPDTWDQFMEDYKKAGYAKIVEEVNAWYDKTK